MAQVVDPVCGMIIDSQDARATADYQGQTYYFCSSGCKNAFEKDPQRYVEKQQRGQSSQKQ